MALTFFVSSASFASFPVTNKSENASSKKSQKHLTISDKENAKMEKRAIKAQAFTKKIEKIQSKLKDKAAKGDNPTVAIILAIVSVLILPFGLHNWYLGRKKQALWQTLLVIPGFILLVPPLISWIWQVVDLIRLLINGELPS